MRATHREWKVRSVVGTAFCLLGLAGCGSGGSGGGAVALTRAVATQQGVQTAKETRATSAITNLTGRSAAHGAAITKPGRRLIAAAKHLAELALTSSHTHRATATSYDSSLGLWLTTTSNADGSGRIDVYTDEALQNNVGFFAIDAVKWNGAVGSLPASIHEAYNFKAGDHPGSGTMDLTVTAFDSSTSTLTAGSISGKITDATTKETESLNLTFSSGAISGPVRFTNKTGWTQLDINAPSGSDETAAITSSYGMKGSLVMHSDTSGILSETTTNGIPLLTMTWNSDGSATVTYPDGSTNAISNVDTQ